MDVISLPVGATALDNDTRGWIMTVVSGLACVFGASIICVDIIVRKIPGKEDFRIQDSNVFLGASLSLSFGVMLFSALYGMLPSSKNYLEKAGFSPSVAAWILVGGFALGFIGIQIVSRFLHSYIPSHVVDCDHTHTETNPATPFRSRTHSTSSHHHAGSHGHHGHNHQEAGMMSSHSADAHGAPNDTTPLLAENGNRRLSRSRTGRMGLSHGDLRSSAPGGSRRASRSLERRPSMVQIQKRVMSFVKDQKNLCDEGGPCYGYSDPCGQECFKYVGSRSQLPSRAPTMMRTATFSQGPSFRIPVLREERDDESDTAPDNSSLKGIYPASRKVTKAHSRSPEGGAVESDDEDDDLDVEAQHHHHVPENAFLSIGLQTSLAIALHKLPEGFITYATNHANPTLGFAVFMALFIHNITEGFAMALPLYLALKSRVRAMFWSSLLGGISQPLGAGIAALWFKLAGNSSHAPGFAVYGCMFAVTSGIMASVALHLFVEALSLNHNHNLGVGFAFLGMILLGISNALTA